MSGIQAVEAITILAVFLGGIVLGAMVMVSIAVKREDRRYSLSGAAPDFATRSARLLIGVGRRGNRVWEQ
jgi:hypothetical protein